MDEVITALQGSKDGKLASLKKFNTAFQTYSTDGIANSTIKRCFELIFENIDDETIQSELLLFCKTLVREKRVADLMTPQLFVRFLEISQLTNIHEGNEFDASSLQARRAVFNITYHNSNCQAACYEAQADLNLFKELQQYRLSQEHERSVISCKMAFLFTAVSESMRSRAIDNDALSILSRITVETLYGSCGPHFSKINCGKKRNVRENSITLSEEDLVICADVFMAVFNVTLHWDKMTSKMACTDDITSFIHLIRCIHSGLNYSEKSEKYQTMVAKFLPIMINTTAQFPTLFLPAVQPNFTGPHHLGRDMGVAKGLLKQLENEVARKSGNTMIIMSIVSVLNKLTVLRAGRKFLRKEILPPLRKVTKRPEEETHLIKSKVVKLMTHVDNSVAVLASELIFTICKNNVNRMIKYTGYGNAAGLFNRHGLMGTRLSGGGGEEMSADEDSDTEEYKGSAPDVDLVTAGPARENTAMNDMTEEEKEVEANKLINLLDGMHRKGVIKPGSVGEDGKIKEMDLAEQLAKMPDIASEDDEEDDEEDLKLDSNGFYPRKKPA